MRKRAAKTRKRKNNSKGSSEMTNSPPKLGKKFGFNLIFIGLIFLFNPEIAIVDVLPDLFGYLLIAIGLRNLRDLCPHMEFASARFSKMIIVGAAKLFSIAFVFGLTSFDTRPTTILLVGFSFAVIELIVVLPAWNSLFDGIIYLSQRTVAGVALKSDSHGRDYTTKIKKYTVFFVCAKNALAVLPEFCSLSGQSYDDTAFDWSRFVGMFRILACMLALMLGVVFLIRAMRYFWRIGADSQFIIALKEKYNAEVAVRTGLFVHRNIKFSLAVATVASLLSVDLLFSLSGYMDILDIIPDFVCGAAFVFVFSVFVRFSPKKAKRGIVVSALYTVISAVSWILNNKFVHEFAYYRIWKDSDAYSEFFTLVLPFSIVEGIIFVIIFVMLLSVIKDLISEHCGYIPDSLPEDYRSSRSAAITKALTGKMIPVAVLAGVVGICNAIAGLMMSIPGFASGEGRTNIIILSETWWIITLAFSLLLTAVLWSFLNAVKDEVESRYMLD